MDYVPCLYFEHVNGSRQNLRNRLNFLRGEVRRKRQEIAKMEEEIEQLLQDYPR